MNYNEFKDYVKEHVLDYLPEQYKNANIEIRQAVKNNDVVLDGLTIFNPNGNMSPTIYLNAAYEEYQQGMGKNWMVVFTTIRTFPFMKP